MYISEIRINTVIAVFIVHSRAVNALFSDFELIQNYTYVQCYIIRTFNEDETKYVGPKKAKISKNTIYISQCTHIIATLSCSYTIS